MGMAGHAGLLGLVRLDLDLVAGWEEGVEAHDELWMALEEHRHAGDHAGGVDRLGFKLLHNMLTIHF